MYEIEFADTASDGVYRFGLEARSEDPKEPFHRRITLFSVLVGDPDAAGSSAAISTASKGFYDVRVMPATKGKRPLGPFLGSVLKVSVANGKTHGPLNDNLDGSYSQSVSYHGKDSPIISLELLGKSVAIKNTKRTKAK